MPIELFQGPRLKVERAKRHIGELHKLCADLIQRNPYILFSEEDTNTNEIVIRVRVKEDVPCAWGTIVGDIAHNLRAALDHLICDLVVANGKSISKTNGFLITGSRETFETYLPKKIEGISRKAEQLIRRFKPYHRGHGDKFGCSVLYLLDWLDDLDKHKGIVMVGAAIPASRVKTIFPGHRATIGADGMVDIRLPAMGRPQIICPLQDNAELFRIAKAGLKHQLEFAFTVAVAEAPVFQGQPIVKVLADAANFIEKGINVLERYAR
jgi:hypothetical protein